MSTQNQMAGGAPLGEYNMFAHNSA